LRQLPLPRWSGQHSYLNPGSSKSGHVEPQAPQFFSSNCMASLAISRPPQQDSLRGSPQVPPHRLRPGGHRFLHFPL
jgi:hypothetical protein